MFWPARELVWGLASSFVCVLAFLCMCVCVCIRGLFNKCEYQDIVVKDKSVTTYFITNILGKVDEHFHIQYCTGSFNCSV